MFTVLLVLSIIALFGATAWAIPTGDGANPADNQEPKELRLMSSVKMKRTTVPLSKIKLDPQRFCHREGPALEETALQPLMNSLIIEGMQVPVEGYFDKDGNFVVVKGHRRVMSHLILVKKNTPNFTADMTLDAIELEDYTHQDLLVRSVADNENRLNLDRIGRIKAAKKMFDGGVEEGRAAAALSISVKTYQRDLLLAKNAWMFQHVIDGSVEATTAIQLLEAAEKYNRVAEVKEDIDAWVADKKQLNREKEKLRKLNGGKDLPDAEKQVKRYFKPYLLEHWLDLIKQGKRFDEDAEWEYAARLDPEKRQLQMAAVSLDLDKDPPEKLAKVGSKLSLLCKQLAPYLQQRFAHLTEEQEVEQAVYDLEYLKGLGGEKMAERLQERVEKAKAESVDGEDEPQPAVEERKEEDLTAQVELPAAPGQTNTASGAAPTRGAGGSAEKPAGKPADAK